MSTTYEAQIDELRQQAYHQDDGPTRVALLEEAVRLADLHQRDDLGFSLRKDLVQAATFGGAPERALVHFSWRLALSDRHPDRYSESDLLWEYKWVLNSLAEFPQISRQQVEDMFADITHRYQRAGYNQRAILKLRASLAGSMGDRAQARRAFRLWDRTPRDSSSDCTACDQNHRVCHYLQMNQLDRALQAAEPILAGRLRCHTVPHTTLSRVLYPLLRRRRLEEAMAAHCKGYRLIRNNPEFRQRIADHLSFLTWTDNLAVGLKMFERHLDWVLPSMALDARFSYYLAGRFLFQRLRDAGTSSLRLRLPSAFPAFEPTGRYETASLLQWLNQACAELAARFDARNGNDAYTRRLRRTARSWKQWVTPYPLRSTS